MPPRALVTGLLDSGKGAHVGRRASRGTLRQRQGCTCRLQGIVWHTAAPHSCHWQDWQRSGRSVLPHGLFIVGAWPRAGAAVVAAVPQPSSLLPSSNVPFPRSTDRRGHSPGRSTRQAAQWQKAGCPQAMPAQTNRDGSTKLSETSSPKARRWPRAARARQHETPSVPLTTTVPAAPMAATCSYNRDAASQI